MQFTFESQGTSTFLVYEMTEKQVVDSVTMGMVSNNRIDGIIPFHYSQLDTKRYLKYNVSSKVSLADYFNGIVNRSRLVGVMDSIARAVLNAQDYMIEVENFVWNTEYIFVDVTNATAQMICLPVMNEDNDTVEVGKFLKNMLLNVQFDQTENCDYVAKLLGFFNANAHFSLQDFLQVLRTLQDNDNKPTRTQLVGDITEVPQPQVNTQSEIKVDVNTGDAVQGQSVHMTLPVNMGMQQNVPNIQSQPQPQGNSSAMPIVNRPQKKGLFGKKDSKELKAENKPANRMPGNNMSVNMPGSNAPMNMPGSGQNVEVSLPGRTNGKATVPGQSGIGNQYTPPSYQTQKASFGGTVVLNESNKTDGTTVLNNQNAPAAQKAVPYLVRTKNQQKIPVTKEVFVIGSDMEKADFPVGDNRAVSKRHAELHVKNGQIYIVDNASTNHTFVAGNMIPSNKEVLLQDKSKFVLANEEFELHIS